MSPVSTPAAGKINHFSSNIETLLQETLRETFEFLRPASSRHKTNTEFEIRDRAIIIWMFDPSFGFNNLHYHKENQVRSRDNVFHLLDGKGPIKYPGDLLTAIREAIEAKKWECETEYFSFKWYKNGNCHIKFKRPDLVQELNRRAGGDRLKPENS